MPHIPATLYDARGNRYVVASPDQIADCGTSAKAAAASHARWATGAIAALCCRPGLDAPVSDGLVVGPFEDSPPFSALIVNTDGTLAERSGNGLTIFAQALRDAGLVEVGTGFDVNVHHATPGHDTPVAATLTPTDTDGRAGVWVAMGQPSFGPEAVHACAAIAATSTARRDTNHVADLAAIDGRWCDSVLVRVGNPHCVTWVRDAADLPDFDALGQAPWAAPLTQIAFARAEEDAGARVDQACKNAPAFRHGINLQWAARLSNDRIAARIFERGEGPTRSSGSSATAVASAARRVGLVTAETVHVEMPGGVASLRMTAGDGDDFTVDYLGVADPVCD